MHTHTHIIHIYIYNVGAAGRQGAAGPDQGQGGMPRRTASLHVEYAGRGKEYGILFIFSLFCEYIHLEYVRIHGIYGVNQAEYVTHVLVVAPQEYVNTYSTRRTVRRRQFGGEHRPFKDALCA